MRDKHENQLCLYKLKCLSNPTNIVDDYNTYHLKHGEGFANVVWKIEAAETEWYVRKSFPDCLTKSSTAKNLSNI